VLTLLLLDLTERRIERVSDTHVHTSVELCLVKSTYSVYFLLMLQDSWKLFADTWLSNEK